MGLGYIGKNYLRLVGVMATNTAYPLSAMDFNDPLIPGRSAMSPVTPGVISLLMTLCAEAREICQREPGFFPSQVEHSHRLIVMASPTGFTPFAEFIMTLQYSGVTT